MLVRKDGAVRLTPEYGLEILEVSFPSEDFVRVGPDLFFFLPYTRYPACLVGYVRLSGFFLPDTG